MNSFRGVVVGWSCADNSQHVSTTPEAARDVNAFVSIIFDIFDEFKGRAFHLAGESYGVRELSIISYNCGVETDYTRQG